MLTPPTIPAHVRPDQVFDFDIYADPRITDDVQGSYATVLRNAPDIFWTPANGGSKPADACRYRCRPAL